MSPRSTGFGELRLKTGRADVDELRDVLILVAIRISRRLGPALALSACLLCLAAAAAQPAAAGRRKAGTATTPVSAPQVLDVLVSVALVPGSGSALHYRGTFTGQPLGHGTVAIDTKLVGASAVVNWMLRTAHGTLNGSGSVTIGYNGATIQYAGPAMIIRGTGAYRTFRSTMLQIAGSTGVNPKLATIRLSGPITV